jgi:hypothetical protein
VVVIRGRYEYDDASLTPGKKKEGGLHQNLFDAAGNLRANARFIPDEDQTPSFDPFLWTTSPGRPDDDDGAGLSEAEREQLRLFLEEVVLPLLVVAIQRGAPYAQSLWREKVRPSVRARLDGLTRRLPRRRLRIEKRPSAVVEGTVVQALSAEVINEPRIEMTATEIEARRLLAVALREASDEQLRLLARASVVADEPAAVGGHELQAVADLDAAPLMARLKARPASLTSEETLTAIHLLLEAGRSEGEPHGPSAVPSRTPDQKGQNGN